MDLTPQFVADFEQALSARNALEAQIRELQEQIDALKSVPRPSPDQDRQLIDALQRASSAEANWQNVTEECKRLQLENMQLLRKLSDEKSRPPVPCANCDALERQLDELRSRPSRNVDDSEKIRELQAANGELAQELSRLKAARASGFAAVEKERDSLKVKNVDLVEQVKELLKKLNRKA